MPLLGFLLALLIGISLGLLGGGGSVLTVPVFHYLFDFEVKRAVAMGLVVAGVTSAAGAIDRLRGGRLDWRPVLVFAPPAMLGSFAGARLALRVPSPVQLACFATVMLAASFLMWRGRASLATRPARPHPVLLAGVGGAVGLLTGFVGVGGGFLIVPALVLLLGMPMHDAIGTSLGVIALNAAAGFAGYWGKVVLDPPVIAGFTGLAVVGVVIGTRLGRQAHPTHLRRGFALLLAGVASAILLSTLLRP